jgi:hypothetical protein
LASLSFVLFKSSYTKRAKKADVAQEARRTPKAARADASATGPRLSDSIVAQS